MKASEIKGLAVRPDGTEDTTGRVTDLILDLEERRVLALQVDREVNATTYVLGVGDILQVGVETVTAVHDAVLLPLALASKYDAMPTLGRMLEEKAMTEGGRILGKLIDIEIEMSGWLVTGYDIVPGQADAFQHGEQRLSADQIVSAGAHMLLVADSAGT